MSGTETQTEPTFVTREEFSKALDLIHTMVDRISQVIDPNFEIDAETVEERIKDLDDTLDQLSWMI